MTAADKTDEMIERYKAQEGTWTLTAPDGRTWQADSPLKTVSKESSERIPPEVRLARIMDGLNDAAAHPATGETNATRTLGHCSCAGEPNKCWAINGVPECEIESSPPREDAMPKRPMPRWNEGHGCYGMDTEDYDALRAHATRLADEVALIHDDLTRNGIPFENHGDEKPLTLRDRVETLIHYRDNAEDEVADLENSVTAGNAALVAEQAVRLIEEQRAREYKATLRENVKELGFNAFISAMGNEMPKNSDGTFNGRFATALMYAHKAMLSAASLP